MKISQGGAALKIARLSQVREVTKYVPGCVAYRFGMDIPPAAKAVLPMHAFGTAEAVP